MRKPTEEELTKFSQAEGSTRLATAAVAGAEMLIPPADANRGVYSNDGEVGHSTRLGRDKWGARFVFRPDSTRLNQLLV